MVERHPAAPDRPAPAVDDSVFHLMRRVMQAHNASWHQHVSALTKPQWAMLDALRRYPGIDQVTLGALAATDKGTATDLLRRLEGTGLVVRTRCEQDQRRRLVALTGDGERLATEVRERADALNARFLAPLDAAERDQLRDLLGRLAGPAEAGSDDDG